MVSTHGRRFFLVLLLSARHVASLSLSQFQEIGGFSDMCLNVWVQDIQGCTYRDFINGNSCSSVCLAGMQVIQAEVLMACAGALVSSNTLLGAFLQGEGVAILCPNHNAQGNPQTSTTQVATTTTTSTSATQQDSQTAQETATTMTTTTTTAVTQQIASTTTSTQTIPSTTASPSDTSATTLAISIGAGTQPSSTTSTSSVTTTTANPEAKGFGGVGDAFNILGNDGNSRIGHLSLEGISVTMCLAVLIAATIW